MAYAAIANNTTPHMTLVDWLDDLTVRFLLNLPPSELSSIPRICFQIEEAQWFYEDFIRPANPSLPGLNLRQFLLALFQHCPLLQGFDDAQHLAAYEAFLSYKTRVPVRGAILLDDSMEKALLVKGWKKGASWSFPRGKINKDEPDLDCAIREVYEETGFDMNAAGLVQANLQSNGQVKAIEITMKEQHMKLFVFRGVALDTHFEPKTRKEISRIQWYNIKDLPGFKKQRGPGAHGQGGAQSSKFYMVAPFIGHLKSWIKQQRRSDTAALQSQHARNLSDAQGGMQTGITEDGGETEQEGFLSDAGVGTGDHSADELKRLLSIGVPPTRSAQQHVPQDPSNDLLAMLRGVQTVPSANPPPHTPFEQIDPMFPSKPPQTPQPHHPRQPPNEHLHVPQFSYSPQRLQHQSQRLHGSNMPMPFTGYQTSSNQFGPQSHNHASGLPMQQHVDQSGVQGSSTGFAHGPQLGPHANAAAHSLDLFQQTQQSSSGYFGSMPVAEHHNESRVGGTSASLASPMHFETGLGRPPPAIAQVLQDTQKPIGSETPEASKLPSLNTQSKKLLDFFKIADVGKPTAPTRSNAPTPAQRTGTVQQAALLDLFKKPSATSKSLVPKPDRAASLIPPAATDITEDLQPPKKAPRESLLDENTRTLPPKSSSAAGTRVTDMSTAFAQSQQHASILSRSPASVAPHTLSGLKHGQSSSSQAQLSKPANPQRPVRATSGRRGEEQKVAVAPVAILQRPSSQQGPRAIRVASPKIAQKFGSNGHGQPPAAINVLQRPRSAAGKAHAFVPQSPLRHETREAKAMPYAHPRPAEEPHAPSQTTAAPLAPTSERKDQLLSLFAKAPPRSVGSPLVGNSVPYSQTDSRTIVEQHDALQGLFDGGEVPSIPPAKTPDPPPAPQLQPERKSSGQSQRANGSQPQHSQQLLLNLFHKPSSSTVSSPSTPISPFSLGTPISREPTHGRLPLPLPLQPPIESRSRLGSVTSAASLATPTASGQGTPTSATPTNETKGFLLDYLNGVVQKEGFRGAKRG